MGSLKKIDFDPFAQQEAPVKGKLVPVSHDPFQTKQTAQQPEPDTTYGDGNVARKLDSTLVEEGKKVWQDIIDTATGASSLMRGAGNLIAPGDKKEGGRVEGFGDYVWPKDMSTGGGYETLGKFVDPVSWAIGAGVSKTPYLGFQSLVGQKLLPAIGRTVTNAAGGAATGGIIGAIDEDMTAGEGAASGALMAGLLPAGFAASSKAGRGIRNLIEPYMGKSGLDRATGRMINEVVGDKKDAIIKALDNPSGRNLTAGQAAVPAGSSEFSGLQAIAKKYNNSPYQKIENSQRLNRREIMDIMAGDDAKMNAALSAREIAADYGNAFKQAIKGDSDLMKLAENPYFKDALPDAMKIAQAEGISSKQNTAQFLHYIKLSLDDQLRKNGDSALSSTSKKGVMDLKHKLVNWMENKNPLYAKARKEWAEKSAPINRMQVAGELTKKLGVKGVEPGAVYSETPGTFLRSVDDTTDEAASRIIKKATGNPRGDLADIMSKPQMKAINKVASELQRDKMLEELSAGGVDKARRIVGDFSDSVPQTNLLSRPITIANAIIKRMEGGGSEAIMQNLSEIMQDPRVTAEVMKKVTPTQGMRIAEALLTRAATIGTIQGDK